MAAGHFKDNTIFDDLINQQPVGFYMALKALLKFTNEFMFLVFCGKAFLCYKKFNDSFKFLGVFP